MRMIKKSNRIYSLNLVTRHVRYVRYVCMIKKSHHYIVSNKIARSLVAGDPKSFWDDVKKIKRNSFIIPNSVDNAKGANE